MNHGGASDVVSEKQNLHCLVKIEPWLHTAEAPSGQLRAQASAADANAQGALAPTHFRGPKEMVLKKQTLPNCTECYGCTTTLKPMSNCSKQHYFNRRCAWVSCVCGRCPVYLVVQLASLWFDWWCMHAGGLLMPKARHATIRTSHLHGGLIRASGALGAQVLC